MAPFHISVEPENVTGLKRSEPEFAIAGLEPEPEAAAKQDQSRGP